MSNDIFWNFTMSSFKLKGRELESIREDVAEQSIKISAPKADEAEEPAKSGEAPEYEKKDNQEAASEDDVMDFLENSGKMKLALTQRCNGLMKDALANAIISDRIAGEVVLDRDLSLRLGTTGTQGTTPKSLDPQYPDDKEPYTSMRQEAEALRQRLENPEPYNEKYPPKVEKDPYCHNTNSERITYYDENGNVIRTDIVYYYENGNVQSRSASFQDSDGKSLGHVSCSYEEDGTLTYLSTTVYDGDKRENPYYTPYHTYVARFDEQGRIKNEDFNKYVDSYTPSQLQTWIEYTHYEAGRYTATMREVVRSGKEKVSDDMVKWTEDHSLDSVGVGLQATNYVWPNEAADTDSNKFIDLYPDAFVEYMNRGDWGDFWWIGASYNGSTMSMNLTDENLDKLLSDDSAWTSDIRYQKNYIDALKAMAGIESTDSKAQAKDKLIKLFSQFGGAVSENSQNGLNIENIDILSFYKAFGNTRLGSSLGIEEGFSEWQFQKLANEAFMENSGFCDAVIESEQFEEFISDPSWQVHPYVNGGDVALNDFAIANMLATINGPVFDTKEGYYNAALAKMAGLSEDDTIEEARQKILDLLQNYALDSNGIIESDGYYSYENIDLVKFYKDLMKADNGFKEYMVRSFMSQNSIIDITHSMYWGMKFSTEGYKPEQTINILKEKTYFAKSPFHMAIAYAAGVTDEEIQNGDFAEIEKKIRKFYNEKLKGLNGYEILDYLFRNGFEGPIMENYRIHALNG